MRVSSFAVQESCSPPLYLWQVLPKSRKAIECLIDDRRPEALNLLEEASENQEKGFEDFKAAFTSRSPQYVHELAAKLANEPRFQALMKQGADFSKRVKFPTSSDSGTR